MFKKDTSKNNNLLFYSSIFHFLSCLCSVFCDYKNNDSQILTFQYFLYFLSWWSFHASLMTLIVFFYSIIKKIIWKNESEIKDNYWEKVVFLIFANANFISMFIFIIGAFSNIFLNKRIIPVSRNEKIFYWIYALCWHLVGPILAIKHFCNLDVSSLKKNKYKAFTRILIHPLMYFLFIVIRAANVAVKKIKYPYSFFDFVMKKRSNFLYNFFAEFIFALSFYIIFYLTSIFVLSINRRKNYIKNLKIDNYNISN